MKKIVQALIILVVVFWITSCGNTDVAPDNTPNLRTLSSAEQQLSLATDNFSFTLFNQLQSETPQNLFISPLSVSVALGMTLNGAGGETQQGILNTIDFGSLTADEVNQGFKDLTALLLSMDKRVNLGLANSVWYSDDYTVQTGFSDAITTYYDGVVKGLDFGASGTKDAINGWVEDKTHGRIKNLIEQISPDEVMYLINTIYFKGDWTYSFDKSQTKEQDFQRLDGSITPVVMMHANKAGILYYGDIDGTLAIDIPYGNGQFNLLIALPNEATDFEEFTASLSSEKFTEWTTNMSPVAANLSIPKFKMTWKKDIRNDLMALGMPAVDFPKLFNEPADLGISKVIHQSFLDINEVGTEAAAATAVGIELTSAGDPKPLTITIDRPFVFILHEKHSNTILFMGQLVDPGNL